MVVQGHIQTLETKVLLESVSIDCPVTVCEEKIAKFDDF